MSGRAMQIMEEALELPAEERAAMADQLLCSLGALSREIDELWAIEVEDRLAALAAGHLQLISAEEVFAELDQM